MSSASWNLFPLRAVFTLGKGKCNQENWDCLDKPGCEVLARCARPWVRVGRTSRGSSCSVNLQGGFDESLPYWCLIRPSSFWEPMTILCHHFTDICDCVCISRCCRTPASCIVLKILTSVWQINSRTESIMRILKQVETCFNLSV
jgi:hypothetical protein